MERYFFYSSDKVNFSRDYNSTSSLCFKYRSWHFTLLQMPASITFSEGKRRPLGTHTQWTELQEHVFTSKNVVLRGNAPMHTLQWSTHAEN